MSSSLIQNAIKRGEITFAPPTPKGKRGPKPRPEIHAAYKKAVELWEKQLTLPEVCSMSGISINTFRSYYYKKGR